MRDFVVGLFLAPLAPFYFACQWLFMTDHEYVVSGKEKAFEIARRLVMVALFVVGVWLLFVIVNGFPDEVDSSTDDGGCIPYGNCY